MSNNWLQDLIKQQKELQERFIPHFELAETTQKIKGIVPPIYHQSIATSPIYQYAIEMQAIINKFAFVDLSTYNNLTEIANDFLEEKQKAEDNYYHRLVVEENEIEIRNYKQQNIELEQKVKELEITLKTMCNIIPAPTNKSGYNKPLSLKPNVTPSQIVRLHEYLKDIFTATLEQWKALFSDTEIILTEPIKAQAPADVAVLLYYLKEKELIDTSKYPSIVERAKAFSVNDKILTAKQINKCKNENYNFPNIGKNYLKISEI